MLTIYGTLRNLFGIETGVIFMWAVFMIYPNGSERKVSCALADHRLCVLWVSWWKSAGEKFENDTFRIVNLEDF